MRADGLGCLGAAIPIALWFAYWVIALGRAPEGGGERWDVLSFMIIGPESLAVALAVSLILALIGARLGRCLDRDAETVSRWKAQSG
jgi:hypothetical protein